MSSIHLEPAVDVEGLAGDVVGVGRAQERHRPGHILRAARPLERNLLDEGLHRLAGLGAHEPAAVAVDLLPHGRRDHARADGVDVDIVRAQGQGRRLRDADDGGLARGVGHLHAASAPAGDRGEVDDLAVAAVGPPLRHDLRRNLPDHLPGDRLHAEYRPLEIHVDHAVPVLLRKLQERLRLCDPRGVDENIDPAELGDDAVHHGLNLGHAAPRSADEPRTAGRATGSPGPSSQPSRC